MAKFELKLPKMGESVAEATITTWLKNVGDTVELDEAVLEIATDKVDSDVPSEVEGVLIEKLFNADDVVQVGQTIAIIETEDDNELQTQASNENITEDVPNEIIEQITEGISVAQETLSTVTSTEDRFYSPLVKNIAKEEGVSQTELDALLGTGKGGRVTKDDVLDYLKNRSNGVKSELSIVENPVVEPTVAQTSVNDENTVQKPISVVSSGEDEIIEMTRMGKMVSNHMMDSIQTSAHVQSFIEADVTKIWNWRNKVKTEFEKREGEKLTFTPIFMEVVAKALKEYPMLNISVQGDKIIKKKNINIGMAAALEDGNLIVPVIKNADQLNLVGMTKQVNDLANRARSNKLKPDDVQGGTYTVTNVGSFGSIMGTPIINQPQVGILALGAIRKVPAVIETEEGDFIGIRYRMFLSHSYDHRVVNGALGGLFVKTVKDYLEAWDVNREV
ncbi:diapophytoene dehydrogenase [Pseudalgibacter alginicilyticus]|uniref:Dihydrolipoamide acetyltransferase component of pyruvate dehydrogenase complex n=1 Tax=Pseudalgibacter alginicilyticus TaxID=1736674 RepID=A0A0P0D924_9FLAO|nr:dihydrolipoamide acetyltransferase family protein [Pseudalgibacter alginicilyticus]ALJ06642.1 diapophytoene dehydrogenase [Pseudalgibacter alginicilyticus]